MEATSERAVSAGAAKSRKHRTVRVGDLVTIERRKLCGGEIESLTFRLAERTDRGADPMELGPEVPIHQKLLGHKKGETVKTPGEAKILRIQRDSGASRGA